MSEKKFKLNGFSGDAQVPISINGHEYKKLKENLELFNNTVFKESKITFDEFISLVFETTALNEKLNSKYEYLNILEDEIKQLEDELTAKYCLGLTGCDDVVELRRKILKDSSDYIGGSY